MTETAGQHMNSRDAIFTSIRESLASSRPFDAAHQKHHRPETPPVAMPVPEVGKDQLIENFGTSIRALGVDCRIVLSREAAAGELHNIIRANSARRIAVSRSELVAELFGDRTGLEVLSSTPIPELFLCDIGVTSAQWGIAETGTLVLESEREDHRLTSLVPPVHVCVLEGRHIRQTLAEILDVVSKDLSRTVTFITGASRTSDIELTLAIGVHGPKKLYVIVLDEQKYA